MEKVFTHLHAGSLVTLRMGLKFHVRFSILDCLAVGCDETEMVVL